MNQRPARAAAIAAVFVLIGAGLPALATPAGAQTLTCNGKAATIVGTPVKDRIIGTDGDDVIVGLGGADVIFGGLGSDTICGGDGPDKLYGGRHADVIFGEQGNDRIYGEAGSDELVGSTGRDIVVGGAGADIITGNGGGDRRLKGGAGSDSTNGGSGSDRCEVDPSDSNLNRCEVDIEGRPIGDPPPDDPDVAALYRLIEDEILPTYGAEHPWIGSAWTFIKQNGTIEAGPEISGGYVQTECRFFSDELATCNSVNMAIGSNNQNQTEVVLHELAHVYEQTTHLAGNRSAMGIALLYIEETYPNTSCPGEELIADVMVRTVLPNSVAPYWRFNCGNSVPRNPTAADIDVVTAGLANQDHPWLTNTFSNGEQAWTALFSHDGRSELATALADQYGGYCSARHTNDVLYFDDPDTNPFVDGGC